MLLLTVCVCLYAWDSFVCVCFRLFWCYRNLFRWIKLIKTGWTATMDLADTMTHDPTLPTRPNYSPVTRVMMVVITLAGWSHQMVLFTDNNSRRYVWFAVHNYSTDAAGCCVPALWPREPSVCVVYIHSLTGRAEIIVHGSNAPTIHMLSCR